MKDKKAGSAELEERLALLGRCAGVGLWDVAIHNGDPMDPGSRWHWSPEFRRLLGFDGFDRVGFPEVVSSWSDRLHPDDAEATFKAFSGCLNDFTGRTGYDVMYRLRMKDGSYRWFRAIGGVSRDNSGRPLRACGSLVDVDAEQDELERSRLLDGKAGVGLWDLVVHDGDPWHERSAWRCSGEFRRLLGFAPDDTVAVPNSIVAWRDRLHPDDVPPVLAAIAEVANDRTGSAEYDVVYRMKAMDGEYRWFRATGGVARDANGVPIRACGTLVDIDAQRRAEMALRFSEAKYRRIVDTANEGILILDVDNVVIFGNAKLGELFGCDWSEIAGHPITDFIFPEDMEAHQRKMANRAKGVSENYERRIRRRDGRGLWTLVSTKAITDDDGRYGGAIAMLTDIDDRVRAEAALREKAEMLQMSNADLERYAYVASHDLQTPLRNVILHTQLLQRKYEGKLDAEADELVSFIVNSARKMAQLVNDLLDYSKVTSRGKQLDTVSAGPALAEALQNLQEDITAAGACVTASDLPCVRANHTQLVRLFQNLVENALRHHRNVEGRSIVRIKAEVGEQDDWRFSVSDNGPGIEPEYHEKIFEIFQQLNPQANPGGSGIGLAICRQIVQRLGGRIWVESALGEGATFFFTLLKA